MANPVARYIPSGKCSLSFGDVVIMEDGTQAVVVDTIGRFFGFVRSNSQTYSGKIEVEFIDPKFFEKI